MEQQARTLRLRLEHETVPDNWLVSAELASVISIASAANRAAKDPEIFDLTFTTLLYGFLRASDSCCRFFQKYAAESGLELSVLLARKGLSDEKLAQLRDTPTSGNQVDFVYTVSAKNLLTNARQLRPAAPNEPASMPVEVRHLMGAYIYQPAGHAADLNSMGISRVDWSKAFRHWIRGEYPSEASHWDQVGHDTFKIFGEATSQAAAQPVVSSRSARVVFDNDLVLERIALDKDRLNMRPEVERLASLLAAQKIHPPIALGLFGRWGSGKSFFMGMLRTRIDELAKVDTSGEYAANAVQVTFNAWHYQDSSLWASLALRIFEGIATSISGKDPSNAAKIRQELHSKLESSVKLKKEAEDRRDAAVTRRAAAAAALEKAQQQRTAAQSKLSAARLQRVWAKLAENRTFEQHIAALKRDVAALGLNPAADGIDDIARMQSQLQVLDGSGRALVGALGASFRDLKSSMASCVIVAAVIAAVVLLHKAQQTYDWLPASTTVYQLLTVVGAGLAWCTRRLNQLSSAARNADALRQNVASAWADNPPSDEEKKLAGELEAHDATIQKANNEIAAAEQRTAEAEAEIQRINAGGLVYDFLTERRSSNAYLAHIGLISTIRQDFEKLGALLDDLNTSGTKPIDRIILYIDDLDRCDPDKVVEVLQAVHLLLAFDIFNVVVGVDARWLERALNEMYGRTMTQAAQTPAASPFRAQNYLEKIFQISYSLGAMNRDTFGRLVGDLMPTRSGLAIETTKKEDGGNGHAKSREELAGGKTSGAGADDKADASTKTPKGHDEGVIDLRETVGTLFFEDFEEEFIRQLHPFIETPRLAKRLVNVYRLLRIRASQEDFEAFLSSSSTVTYQAALLLLAINIGYPMVGRKLLSELSSTPSVSSLVDFYNEVVPVPQKPLDPNDIEGSGFETVRKGLAAMAKGLPAKLPSYAHWAPRVGRYSFDWHLVSETSVEPAQQSS